MVEVVLFFIELQDLVLASPDSDRSWLFGRFVPRGIDQGKRGVSTRRYKSVVNNRMHL